LQEKLDTWPNQHIDLNWTSLYDNSHLKISLATRLTCLELSNRKLRVNQSLIQVEDQSLAPLMVGLLARDDSVLRWAWLFTKSLSSLKLLNHFLCKEQFFLEKLGGCLSCDACLLLGLLLLGLLHFLLLEIELLLLLGLGIIVCSLLLLLHLDLLRGDILALVDLTLALVQLVHLLVLLLGVAHGTRCVQARLVLGLLGTLGALVCLLQETVSACGGVSALAGLNIGELLTYKLGVNSW
jgi:hypothetical protein